MDKVRTFLSNYFNIQNPKFPYSFLALVKEWTRLYKNITTQNNTKNIDSTWKSTFYIILIYVFRKSGGTSTPAVNFVEKTTHWTPKCFVSCWRRRTINLFLYFSSFVFEHATLNIIFLSMKNKKCFYLVSTSENIRM